ncbi:MAG: ribonuclease III [Dethiobacteria bacterium]
MKGHRLEKLLQNLKWSVNDYELYEQALTHSSYAYEFNLHQKHNRRLEFLGDAVLELVISDYLYHRYKKFPEGKLTRMRADIVCEQTLARLANDFELGKYLLLGKGEAQDGGHKRRSLLADALEALIGALYLDLGYKEAYRLIINLFKPVFNVLEEGVLRNDYKTQLQELSQSRFGEPPKYELIEETGPDHRKVFDVELFIAGKAVSTGEGHSKKDAEQAAAKAALEKFKNSSRK